MTSPKLSSEAYALALLEGIVDPCSVAAGVPASIVAMGLIRRLDIQEQTAGDWQIGLELRLTGPSCLLGPAFCNSAQAALLAGGYSKATVTVASDFEWTPENMRAALRDRAAKARLADRKATFGDSAEY